jgi:hypothetical protein
MLKTIASLTPRERYEMIGAEEAKKILKGMDYTTRNKLKVEAINLRTRKTSAINFIRNIGRKHGRVAASKLIGATQKHFNKDIDPKIQKGYLKANMQRDLPGRETKTRQYAGGKVTTGSIGVAKEKGDMTKIGVSRGTVGFAGSYGGPASKPSIGAMPKAPAGGTRPIGL